MDTQITFRERKKQQIILQYEGVLGGISVRWINHVEANTVVKPCGGKNVVG